MNVTSTIFERFSQSAPHFGHILPNGKPCGHAHHHRPMHPPDQAHIAKKHSATTPASEKQTAESSQKNFFAAFFHNLLNPPPHTHAHHPNSAKDAPRSLGEKVADAFRYLLDWFKEAIRHITHDTQALVQGPVPSATPDHTHDHAHHHDHSHAEHTHSHKHERHHH